MASPLEGTARANATVHPSSAGPLCALARNRFGAGRSLGRLSLLDRAHLQGRGHVSAWTPTYAQGALHQRGGPGPTECRLHASRLRLPRIRRARQLGAASNGGARDPRELRSGQLRPLAIKRHTIIVEGTLSFRMQRVAAARAGDHGRDVSTLPLLALRAACRIVHMAYARPFVLGFRCPTRAEV